MKKKKKSLLKRTFHFILKLHLWFWGIIAFFCLIYQFINPPITTIMLHRYLVRGYSWHKRYYIPLEKIPNRTIKMVMTLEDPNFKKHWGFEWKAVKNAYKKNKRSGRIRLGASTISNQLARTLFLTTHRNYFRKYLEVQITVIMEIIMSKKRMLELYMNYIEWGKGIYGIETASRYYFGKKVRSLDNDEKMRLVSIMTSPIKYSPKSYSKSRSASQRYNILRRMY